MRVRLSYKFPPKLSFLVIGGIVVVILLYVSYKIGEFEGAEQQIRTLLAEEKIVPGPMTVPPSVIPEFNVIDPHYLKTDVKQLISLQSLNDVYDKRTQLIRFLWGDPGLPLQTLPSQIDVNFQDSRYEDLYEQALRRIDRLVVSMDFDLQSQIYHFIPQHENGTLVIFHEGHLDDFIKDKEFIHELLKEGYSVAAFCMPLQGLNNRPTVLLPRFGYFTVATHGHMQFLVPEAGHPVKYFLDPVIVFLNYAISEKNPVNIAMIGICGGGWTTTMLAAVDMRITLSVPVAGTYPFYLRSNAPRDWGDYELTVPELYRICNFLELYLLGAHGKGRKQLQIINRYDACCFAGVKWQTYSPVVKEYAELLGETAWDLFMDESHAEHIISPVAREKIFSLLKSM